MNIVGRMKTSDWTTIRYTYDPFGRRTLAPSLVARDSSLECARADCCGCVHGVRERNSIRPSTSNHQSSFINPPSRVIALSDAAGEAAVLYEYGIYGQVAASDPNHPNPLLFRRP